MQQPKKIEIRKAMPRGTWVDERGDDDWTEKDLQKLQDAHDQSKASKTSSQPKVSEK
jgi:hypothetical protein